MNRHHRKMNNRMVALLLLVSCMVFIPWIAECVEVQQSVVPSKQVYCGVLERFEGDVQILNSTRDTLIDVTFNVGIPCGGWISVQKGWADVKHRQGYGLRLGPGTFIEIFDNVQDQQITGEEHVALYRGKLYVEVPKGSEKLRVITANARAKISWGDSLIIFNAWDEETQLVALTNTAVLENRFEKSNQIQIKSGEATSLNFKILRIIPATPRAIEVASLKEKLNDLNLSAQQMSVAVQAAYKRQDRRFASVVKEEKRNPAAINKKSNYSYIQHKTEEGDTKAQAQWVKKLVGGQAVGERILFPEKFLGREQKAQIYVRDPSQALGGKKRHSEEDKEKQKLLQELSELQSE